MKKSDSTFYAKDRTAWREWLQKNHASEKFVWLIIYKKESNTPSVYYTEAVDEALCFGWVDSKPIKRDENSYYQYFAKRNPKSNWSKINKEKVERLIQEKRMTGAGLSLIEEAKNNGAWEALNEVEQLIVPKDLREALQKLPHAENNFTAFPKSSKRNILEWILSAKKAETRQKRIKEAALRANENIRANHYRKPKNR